MSWVEQISTGMIITTGDGKIYRPEYMNAPITEDFNVAEFEFPLIAGTLVKKSEAKGRKYALEIYFQGENHLDTAEEFRKSTKDKRPWQISHPMFGLMFMQPASITYDNTGLGLSKITATMIETITDDAPKVTTEPKNQIIKDVELLKETSGRVYEDRVKGRTLNPNLLSANINSIYEDAETIKKTDLEATDYFNLFNLAESKLLDLTAEPLLAITAVMDVINYPSLLAISVKDRINLLISQYNLMVESVTELLTPDDKFVFENNCTALLGAMAQTVVTPNDETDYGNTVVVLEIAQQLIDTYDDFIDQLDGLQTDNGGDTDSYIPSFDGMSGLASLIDYTVSNLFDIALNSKQERIVLLEDDSNIIILAHRFYGLSLDDETIAEFMRNNMIGLSEILQIKKGRQIKYYV